MNRKKSVTTRIHQPPAPPCWFRTIFYLSFCTWVVLQAATEYYNTRCLHLYTHLPIFEAEKQVTAAFLNIVAVGILTVGLVLTFAYGICAVSKFVVLSSSAFLSTLLILNILAFGVMMSSHFGLRIGPRSRGKRVLTIYHKNVSTENWRHEIKQWAAKYPPGQQSDAIPTEATTPTATASSSPAVAGAAAVDAAASSDTTGAGPPTTPPARDGTEPSPSPASRLANESQLRSVWAESRTLHLLRFFQWRAFCCGVQSAEDYAKHGAQTPPSCRCRDEGHQYGRTRRPPCSARAYTLAGGVASAVWSTGCLQVTDEFIGNVVYLRNLLAATGALQALVMGLGVVLGLNMPSSVSDDSDDEGGEY